MKRGREDVEGENPEEMMEGLEVEEGEAEFLG